MRSEKIQLVNDIGQALTESDYLYFITYNGVNVKSFSTLRTALAKHNASCQVLKNRLIRKAAELHKLESLTSLKLTGDTAMVYGKGDAGTIAKVLKDFAKTQDKVAAKGGYVQGNLLSAADVNAVASLPSREVLYSMLLGVLQAPSRDLVSVLNAKTSTIVNVLNNLKEKLEKNS